MKVFDSIKSKNIDELAEWLAESCNFDTAPWWHFWDERYCNKCKSEIGMNENGNEAEYGYCELHGKCKFFPHMNSIPDNAQTIKMWLKSEIEN